MVADTFLAQPHAEGKVLAQGTAEEVKSNEQVIDAYLGTGLKNKPKSQQVGA